MTSLYPGTAIVIGASGQDGYFLTSSLLAEGKVVHAIVRRPEARDELSNLSLASTTLHVQEVDLTQPAKLVDLVAEVQPEEIYNLAGQSSVSRSFSEPRLTWLTNTGFVSVILETLRLRSPLSRFYQASSTDMFGGASGSRVVYNEESSLNPQSPYASAKAAAHLLCRSYREAYNLRIACGILANHESHRRGKHFLSRKIVDHVWAIRTNGTSATPLKVGNLKIRRDWGFALDYVDGIRLVLRQVVTRAARMEGPHNASSQLDEGHAYRDYILSTGCTYAVWELIDAAFELGGYPLEWHLDEAEPIKSHARFRTDGRLAVEVDRDLLRPTDPLEISVDSSRARRELGWSPRTGLKVFLSDMLNGESEHRNVD
jgi:GDPmannose 4,6-dehydratase